MYVWQSYIYAKSYLLGSVVLRVNISGCIYILSTLLQRLYLYFWARFLSIQSTQRAACSTVKWTNL